MEDYLKSRGVPESFISADPSKLPQELYEKFTAWKKLISRDFPVTVVTGTKTTKKMEFITCLLKEFIPLKKSVFMFFPGVIEADIPPSFLYAIIGMDIAPATQVNYMRNTLFNHVVFNNCPVIIECESIKALENVMYKPFMDAIAEKMIEVNTGSVKTPHTVL